MSRYCIFIVSFLCVFAFMATSVFGFQQPYTDNEQTIALWHMDAVRSSKYMDDDDSVVTDRNANLVLSPNPVDTEGGPILSDPALIPGLDYPDNNPAFHNTLYFDGVDDFAIIANPSLGFIDSKNLRLDGWVRRDGEGDQIFFDRWGQVVLYAKDSELQVLVWDEDNEVHWNHANAGWNPTGWNHFTVEFLSDHMKVFLNGDLSYEKTLPGGGLNATTSKGHTYLGMRYNGKSKFSGDLDEIRISYTVPDTGIFAPHDDRVPNTKALWHFDEYIDPNTTEGIYTPDANSPNRNADMELLFGSPGMKMAAADANGPKLVTPPYYPTGNAGFGKALYLANWYTDAEYARISNATLDIDANDFRVEGWVMLDPNFIAVADGSTNYLFDRWGQMVLSVVDSEGGVQLEGIFFSNDGDNHFEHVNYGDVGVDPKKWHHIAAEVQGDTVRLLINGRVEGEWVYGAPGLKEPGKSYTYLGSRYTGTHEYKFPGYLDEWRITSGPADGNDLPMVDLNKYTIPQAGAAPVPDGVFSPGEWDGATSQSLVYPDLITPPQVGSHKYEEPTPEDFSATLHYTWDQTYLYMGVEVVDDVVIAPAATGGYPDDHILIGFDPDVNNEEKDRTLVFEFFRDNSDLTRTKIYWNNDGALLLTNSIFATSVTTDSQGNKVTYEAALKWSEITGDAGYVPRVGDQYQAAVLLCDNDTDDGMRDTFLLDAGQGNSGAMAEPAFWRDVTLAAPAP